MGVGIRTNGRLSYYIPVYYCFYPGLSWWAPFIYGIWTVGRIGYSIPVTFYEQYLEARKFLSFAGDAILHEIFQKEHSTDVPRAKEQAPVAVTSSSDTVIEKI